MAKAKKITKKEHETMQSTVQLVRELERIIIDATVAKDRASFELNQAREAWTKLSDDLEKKYGSVEVDIQTGEIRESA